MELDSLTKTRITLFVLGTWSMILLTSALYDLFVYFDLLLLFHFVQLLDENAQLIRVSQASSDYACTPIMSNKM